MEGRNQQYLALNHDSLSSHCTRQKEPICNESGQIDMFPNRWLRISSAARKPNVTFENLLCHFKVDTLRDAFNALDGTKALGLDGISKKVYAKDLEANLMDLENRIHKGSYRPQSKREVLIPKMNGKTRPIAISCFEDKIVEHVLAKVLECVYEPIFIRNSFGFRPKKSADNAIKATFYSLKDNKRRFVVEIDLANFFNSILHKKLMKTISMRITDRRFKGLIGKFLKVGILEQSGNLSNPDEGTPQGSIMSPILANVYLHYVLDTWFIENYASYSNIIVRYADDAMFFFKKTEEAESFVLALKERVQKFGLTLNMDKTKTIDFGKDTEASFQFLGFTFYWGKKQRFVKRRLKIKTSQKTLHRKIQDFYNWIKSVRSKLKLSKIWELTKLKLIGHYNYYGYASNLPKLNHFYFEAINSLFKWLNRRSQKISFSWKKFNRKLKFNPLPKPPTMAKLKHIEWRFGCLN